MEKLVLKKLKPILESTKIKIIGQNIKFDRNILSRYGIHLNFIESNPSFVENIKLNYSISPARPISSLMLGFVHPLVGKNIIIYNFISLILWISCALILKKTFKLLINKEFSEIFFIIFSFPYLCFSIFYGNLLWSNYILFIFFWSLSIFFQNLK